MEVKKMKRYSKNRMPKERSEQLERIVHYENILNRVSAELDSYNESRSRLFELAIEVKELEEYYGSELWKKDFADDEAGLIPNDLKRGVLSEDAIYDLLEEYRDATEDNKT